MHFLLAGIVAALALWCLGKLWVSARPSTLRRLLPWLTGAVILLIALMLLRFGLVYGASIAGVLGVLYPLLSRWLPLLGGWWLLRKRQTAGNPTPEPRTKSMTKRQARDILGVGPKADEEEIRTAYRRLMQKNHPDTGGSEYLAQQINEARRVLLNEE